MARRFGTGDVARWREPRRMYEVTAQGAAEAPKLPFHDRGTWEQLVETSPWRRAVSDMGTAPRSGAVPVASR